MTKVTGLKKVPVLQFKDDVWQGPKITENKNYEWVRLPNGRYAWRRKIITNDELRITEKSDDEIPALDLQFLPEGGRWVAGFPCQMAFKALAEDGCGVNVEGEIVNDLGEAVAEFRSQHQGMGSVFLAPQPGRKYHARLFSGHTVDLPAPDSTGVVMTLQPARENTLLLQVYFPPEMIQRNETFNLVAQSRGIYANTWEIQASRTRISQFLPVNDFQTGIARFTLFTQNGIPCNERLIFVDKEDDIKLNITSSKGLGRDSSSMILQLQATDVYDFPVQGVFTVSVTDSLYGANDIRDANLRSQMLLSSDLKGKVEHAGWYFQERDSLRRQMLDLVMQTHGWSGYSWDDVKNAQDKIVYEPEIDYTVSGIVTNLRNKPEKDISVTLWAEGAQSIFEHAYTDEKGRFSFEGLLPMEKSWVYIAAKYKKGRKNAFGLGVDLDKQPLTPSPPVKELTPTGSSETWEELLAMYRQQLKLDEHYLDSLLKITDAYIIEEVTITAKRPVKGSWNLNGPGQADHVLYAEDIARYDSHNTLLDIIKAEFPQLEEVSWRECMDIRPEFIVPDISDYTLWRFQSRRVEFIFEGDNLGPYLTANKKLIDEGYTLESTNPFHYYLLISKNLFNIPAKDIAGIELMDSPEYLWRYDNFNFDGPTRPIIIEITTHSGNYRSVRHFPRIGAAKQHLLGFAVPKAFYIPKYYPEDIEGQVDYDVKPTLYWNPEVVTGRDGKAEIQFPVGLKPRGLQIRVEGIDLRGGIVSMMMVRDEP